MFLFQVLKLTATRLTHKHFISLIQLQLFSVSFFPLFFAKQNFLFRIFFISPVCVCCNPTPRIRPYHAMCCCISGERKKSVATPAAPTTLADWRSGVNILTIFNSEYQRFGPYNLTLRCLFKAPN